MKIACGLLLVTGLSWGTTSHAQGGGVEVGAGLGVFTFLSGGGAEAVQFQTGGGGIYFGIPIGERMAIEPGIGVDYTHYEDVNILVAGLNLALPIYFQNPRQGLFVAPFAGMSFINADAAGVGDSDLQFGFGGSVGGKFPAGERVSLRLELPIGYFLESDYRANTLAIGAQFGVAVFFGGNQ
jgi:hypothetical protein